MAKVSISITGASKTNLPSPNLDSAVTLLDLSGHPHVLGREALAVLEGAACTEMVALVATGGKSTRVIEQRGWNDRDAVRAADTCPEGIEVLPVGRYRDEMWQIVARPKTAIDPYCTFAAIRKLLATAVALDQYRRDEKQRAALWPADALEGDPDSIWASEQMAETSGDRPPHRAHAAVRPPHRRNRHRQRDAGPRDPPRLGPRRQAVPAVQLHARCRATCSRASCSATARAHSPGQTPPSAASSAPPPAARSSSTKSPTSASRSSRSCCASSRTTRSIRSASRTRSSVDVRIVAATNATLEKLVAEGRFREDLFYRLNPVHLKLPPLRERREEIPPLVHHYLRRYGDEQRKGRLTLSDEALEYLLLFSWPGNIRQLANEVRRIVAMVEPDTTITPAMLSPDIQASRRTIPAPTTAQEELRLALDQPLPAAVQLLEQVMVRRALDRSHGRVEEASRILGISRKGLFLKRRRLGFRNVS